MTAQVGEKLLYEGREYDMFNEPLEDYFAQAGNRPEFKMLNTACWRGYIGSWAIIDNELFLIKLSGFLNVYLNITAETLFPGSKGAKLADWYSGVLQIPDGKLRHYVHAGFASEFERDILITIKNGKVIDTTVRENS